MSVGYQCRRIAQATKRRRDAGVIRVSMLRPRVQVIVDSRRANFYCLNHASEATVSDRKIQRPRKDAPRGQPLDPAMLRSFEISPAQRCLQTQDHAAGIESLPLSRLD